MILPSRFLRSILLPSLLALPVGAARAMPLLSEVFYDAVGSDNGQSFVELHAAAGSSLDGLTVEGVNGAGGSIGPVLVLSGSVPPDGIFVVADDAGDGTTAVAEADLLLDFDFQNGPDSIVLRAGPQVLDAVGYGTFGSGDVFAGEGTPAPDAPPGSSLARRFADLDTGDNATDFQVLSTPTPGTALTVVPEPATAVLAAVGLAGLLRLGGARRSRSA